MTCDHRSYPQFVCVFLKDDITVYMVVEGEATECPTLLDFMRDVFAVGTHVVLSTNGSRVEKVGYCAALCDAIR